jgi:hypothetical protein
VHGAYIDIADQHQPLSMFISHGYFFSRAWHKGIPLEIGLATLVVEDDGPTSCATPLLDRKEKKKKKENIQPHCTYHHTTSWLHSVGLGIT